MKRIDIVYYYRDTHSDELRYSIRSAVKNLKVNRVIIVGDKPEWFEEGPKAIFIQSNNYDIDKPTSAYVAYRHMKALIDANLDLDEFLLFNDDFFIMKKVHMWTEYKRDVNDYNIKAQTNALIRHRIQKTLRICDGKDLYNLHMPMKMKLTNVKKVLEFWDNLISLNEKDIDFRTVYGNFFVKNAKATEDCKVFENFEDSGDRTFISTSNESFQDGRIGKEIRKTFDKPSFCEMVE